ncbi:MAG TPA: serine hydrolase [Polyangia bacterium]|nr:serine hydrolase [Polyangia bacterium]
MRIHKGFAKVALAAPFLATLLGGAAAAGPLVPLPAQPPDVPWPTREWPRAPQPASISPALEQVLSVVGQKHPLLGETRAVVIVSGGRLIVERYAPGYGADTPLVSWSVAKSITHALLGVAVRQGRVDVDRPMGNPRWPAGDPRASITWRHWMGMVDGQQYREIDAFDPVENDAARMLFGPGRLDVAAFAASLPLVHPPGTHWNYNSAGINLVADALGRVFAPGAGPVERRDRMAEVLARELWEPLGMSSAQPEFDAAGTFMGSAYVYATARDFARFGLLYLRDGVWEGRRILPPGWVDFARTACPAANGSRYGAGWWLAPSPGPTGPPLPPDVFSAQGHEGQLVSVVPSRDLVVVRLGLFDDIKGFPALRDWMAQLISLFPARASSP